MTGYETVGCTKKCRLSDLGKKRNNEANSQKRLDHFFHQFSHFAGSTDFVLVLITRLRIMGSDQYLGWKPDVLDGVTPVSVRSCGKGVTRSTQYRAV